MKLCGFSLLCWFLNYTVEDHVLVLRVKGKLAAQFRGIICMDLYSTFKNISTQSGWCSGLLPCLQPLGPKFKLKSHRGHYVDWVFNPQFIITSTTWVFPGFILNWNFFFIFFSRLALIRALRIFIQIQINKRAQSEGNASL